MKCKFLIPLGVVMMLFSCNKENKTTATITETTPQKADKEQVTHEIQNLEDGFTSSMNARNTDNMNSYYADDARSYMFGKPVVAGKPAIMEELQKSFKNMPEGAQLSIAKTDMLVADDGKQAVEIGAYKMADASGKQLNNGHYFGYFEKRNGKFVCVREMVTETPKNVRPVTNDKTK